MQLLTASPGRLGDPGGADPDRAPVPTPITSTSMRARTPASALLVAIALVAGSLLGLAAPAAAQEDRDDVAHLAPELAAVAVQGSAANDAQAASTRRWPS